MIKLNINGKEQSWDGDPDLPLLWFLRDEAGLTGTKFGCGQALCGACTVIIDKQAVRSCITSVSDAAGREVTTIEGLHPTGDHRRSESVAAGQRPAMRLLPGRADHAGGRAAGRESEALPRPDPRSDGGQHLPLRLLPAHRERRASRIDGSLIMNIITNPNKLRGFERHAVKVENVSRRSILKGLGIAGGFVLAAPVMSRAGLRL